MSWLEHINPKRVRTREWFEYGKGNVNCPYYTIPYWDGVPTAEPTYPLWNTSWTNFSSKVERVNDRLHRKRGDTYQEGSDFDVAYTEQVVTPADVDAYINVGPDAKGAGYSIHGPLIPRFRINLGIPALPTLGYVPDTARDSVASYGPQAWKKYKPGKPVADLAVFIAELREMPKQLKDTSKFFRDLKGRNLGPRGAAGGYLGYSFGWAPFVRDIKKMYELSQNIDTHIRHAMKNNGKWIHKKGSVAKEKDTLVWENETHPFIQGSLHFSNPKTHGTYTYSRGVWFSGAFRYYIPEMKIRNKYWRANYVRKLYGLSVTPAMVWELTPWSWLVDYFSNVGDVISNMSSGVLGDVVAKYAYVMGTTSRMWEQDCRVQVVSQGEVSGYISRETVVKHRTAANPFGFGTTGDPLNDYQLSILAALGITKFR